ncbi:MAG: hypothetical protein AAGC55_24035, partial [Myxococcota bacterium]
PKLLDFGIARSVGETPSESAFEARQLFDSAATQGAEPVARAELFDDKVITQRGLSIGSPPYMAPEQWLNAAEADARTDQYALAILAYEALTGRRPFRAPSEAGMARAHASKPIPPLGGDFPASLNAVFTRALAKRQADRYGDLLEFATEFRTAAGLDGEAERLPTLDPFVQETVIAQAPQPLAEVVAQLEAARTPRRSLEVVHRAADVVCHLLGIFALAAHSRLVGGVRLSDEGRGEGDEGGEGGEGGEVRGDEAAIMDAASTALDTVRSETIGASAWLELALTLVRPLAATPDAHPVPELVRALSGSSGKVDVPGLLRQLFADAARGEGDGQGESARAAAVGAVTPTRLDDQLNILARVLRALSFLLEFPIVVGRLGRNEVWMGARRVARALSNLRDNRTLSEGEVVMTTPDGEVVMALSPLVQCLSPAPGSPEELFLFASSSRFGAKLVALPVGFERYDGTLWQWYRDNFGERNSDGDGELADAADDERVPYLGLSAFSPADATYYFGREREVQDCVNRLRVTSMLAVVGPSGAGKSSFVQAGIVPALPSR